MSAPEENQQLREEIAALWTAVRRLQEQIEHLSNGNQDISDTEPNDEREALAQLREKNIRKMFDVW